jgi:hypothetical protein
LLVLLPARLQVLRTNCNAKDCTAPNPGVKLGQRQIGVRLLTNILCSCVASNNSTEVSDRPTCHSFVCDSFLCYHGRYTTVHVYVGSWISAESGSLVFRPGIAISNFRHYTIPIPAALVEARSRGTMRYLAAISVLASLVHAAFQLPKRLLFVPTECARMPKQRSLDVRM